MTIAKRTLWGRKFRSNVESDLFSDGVSQFLKTDVDLPTLGGDFSICFFDERPASAINDCIIDIGNSGTNYLSIRTGLNAAAHPYNIILISGGVTVDFGVIDNGDRIQNSLYINKKTFVEMKFIQSETKIECWVNGSLDWSKTDANFTGLVFDGEINIKAFHGGLIEYKGMNSHICVFNRLLTFQENHFILKNGGIVPASAHANCLLHLPLTERYAFKADAAFVVLHPQFSVGDNIFFDAVEQYNYAVPVNAVSKSMIFTGSNSEVVNIPDDASLKFGTGDFTVAVWVKIDTIGAGQEILSKHYSNYELLINGSGNFVGYVGGLSNSVGSAVVSAGEWHHVLITRNGGGSNNLKMYLNGELASQSTNTATTSTTTDIIEIGSRPGEGIFLTGNVCQASIWNQGFSEQEVREAYNHGNPIDELTHSAVANLVSLWEMGGGVGDSITTIVDQQGSNDGTPVNMVAGDIVDDIPIFLPVANHLKTVNYSDDEVGSVDPSTQTAKKNFYSKKNNNSLGVNARFGTRIKTANSFATTVLGADNDMTIVVQGFLDSSNTSSIEFMSQIGYNPDFGFNILASGRLKTVAKGLTGTFPEIILGSKASGNYDKFYTILVSFDSASRDLKIKAIDKGGRIYEDIQTMGGTHSWFGPSTSLDVLCIGSPTIGVRDNGKLVSKIAVFAGVVDYNEYDFDVDSFSVTPEAYYDVSGKLNNTIVNKGSTAPSWDLLTYTGFPTPVIGDGVWLEKDSLLPEIKQAWVNPATGGFTIPTAFNPNSEEGLTFVWSGIVDLSKTNFFFSKRESGSIYNQFYVTTGGNLNTAISGNSPTSVVNGIDINKVSFDKINTYHFIFQKVGTKGRITLGVNGVHLFSIDPTGYQDYDAIVADTTISKSSIGQQDNSTCLRAEIHQGVLTEKQLRRIHNNSLLSNNETPSLLWKMICNNGSFSEDGSDVLINDDSGNGNNAVVSGLTGASSADRLTDVPNHLVDINQLR